jgi:hypothetical protein
VCSINGMTVVRVQEKERKLIKNLVSSHPVIMPGVRSEKPDKPTDRWQGKFLM